jgi:prophage regulatory protein
MRETGPPDRLIRAKEVARMTGLGLSTLYKYQKEGLMPGSFSIGPRCTAWSHAAISQWIEDRKAGEPMRRESPPAKAANLREAVTRLEESQASPPRTSS